MNPWQRKALEKRGVDVIVDRFPDWIFQVRQAGPWNHDYYRATARVSSLRKVRDMLERQSAEDYEANVADMALDAWATRSAFIEGCLAGWSGVTDEAGAALPFTPEAADKLLSTFPEIMRTLEAVSRDASRFAGTEPTADEKEKALLGNSAPASTTRPARGGRRNRRASTSMGGSLAPRE